MGCNLRKSTPQTGILTPLIPYQITPIQPLNPHICPILGMKSLEELAITDYDVQAILPKVIANEVEEAARPQRHARQLLQMVRLGKGRSILVPVRSSMASGRVTEGASVADAYGKNITAGNQTSSAYGTTEITPFKIGSKFQITQEAIDGQNLDVIGDYIKECGEAIAQTEDQELFRIIFDKASLSEKVACSAASKTYQATSYPILSVIKVAKSAAATSTMTVLDVDYKDGKIKCGTNGTTGSATKVILRYAYSKRSDSLFQDASTAKTIVVDDIINSRKLVRVANYKPNIMVIHPNEEAQLLKNSQFIDASKYGDTEPLWNGEIGKIGGMKVLCTTNLWSGVVLYLDTTRAGWFVDKRPIELKKKDRPETDAVELYFYEELGGAITKASALAFSTDHETTYANKAL